MSTQEHTHEHTHEGGEQHTHAHSHASGEENHEHGEQTAATASTTAEAAERSDSFKTPGDTTPTLKGDAGPPLQQHESAAEMIMGETERGAGEGRPAGEQR